MSSLLLSGHALAQPPGEGEPMPMPMPMMSGCQEMMARMGPEGMGGMHAMMTASTVLVGLLVLAAIFALICLGVYLLRRSKTAPIAPAPA